MEMIAKMLNIARGGGFRGGRGRGGFPPFMRGAPRGRGDRGRGGIRGRGGQGPTAEGDGNAGAGAENPAAGGEAPANN